MRNFMKMKNEEDSIALTTDEFIENFKKKQKNLHVKAIGGCLLTGLIGLLIFSLVSVNKVKMLSFDGEESFSLVSAPVAATAGRKDVISIPAGVVKANPFVPYRTIDNDVKTEALVYDVPQFDLVTPPEMSLENKEVAKVMETVVSGILYDKFSPSAILKIEGNDYLVKKGDVILNYKVLNIAQNSVTVQYGKNTYKAGIGELLTEGTVTHNDIFNLDKKFGGEPR